MHREPLTKGVYLWNCVDPLDLVAYNEFQRNLGIEKPSIITLFKIAEGRFPTQHINCRLDERSTYNKFDFWNLSSRF